MDVFSRNLRRAAMDTIITHLPGAGVKEAYALTLDKNERPPRGQQYIKIRADIWGNVRKGWR